MVPFPSNFLQDDAPPVPFPVPVPAPVAVAAPFAPLDDVLPDV